MKKIITLIILLITINCYSQQSYPSLTFLKLVGGAWTPITTLTIDSIRMVDIGGGTYNGTVIYPDNVYTPYFYNLGNGQYTLGSFQHSNFRTGEYLHYVKVQRNIAGTWTDQSQFGNMWLGYPGELFSVKANKTYADSIYNYSLLCLLKSDTNNSVRIYGNQNVYGLKYFHGNICTNQIDPVTGTDVTFPSRIFFTNTTYGTPLAYGQPLYTNSLVTKSWTQSEIETRIQSILAGNYIESKNIIRLMPDGTQTIGQIYVTYATALTYAIGYATYGKQLTVLVCGEGSANNRIDMALSGVKYVTPYTHYRGLGSDIKLYSDGNFATGSSQFEADTLGNITMEDLYFYFDNSGQTGDIKKIIFKNCKFYSNGGVETFTGCQFEGTNLFQSTTDNEFAFVNCVGTPIYSNKMVSVSGTNMIPYGTPNTFILRNLFFSDTLGGGFKTRTIRGDSAVIGTYTIIDINGIKTNNLALSDYVSLSSAGSNIINTTPNLGSIDFVNGNLTSVKIDSVNGLFPQTCLTFKESTTPVGHTVDVGHWYQKGRKMIYVFDDGSLIKYFYFDLTQITDQQIKYSATEP